jgi:spermidine synthase
LDTFGEEASVTVAELLPAVIKYNEGPLAHLAERPLEDPRVTVHAGDVRQCLNDREWDVILMDVDNGPDAFTTRDNERLYSERGIKLLTTALRKRGVMAVWSAYPSPRFFDRVKRAGLRCEVKTVRARWPLEKGPKHTLFIAYPKP